MATARGPCVGCAKKRFCFFSTRSPSSALLPSLFFLGSPTKIDVLKQVGTLVLTSPLEDLVGCAKTLFFLQSLSSSLPEFHVSHFCGLGHFGGKQFGVDPSTHGTEYKLCSTQDGIWTYGPLGTYLHVGLSL